MPGSYVDATVRRTKGIFLPKMQCKIQACIWKEDLFTEKPVRLQYYPNIMETIDWGNILSGQ